MNFIFSNIKAVFFKTGIIVLFSLTALYPARSQTQVNQQKLYMGMDDLGAEMKPFLSQNNIQSVLILDARYYDPKDDGNLDFDLFTKTINNKLPAADVQGIVVLDWEGKAMAGIRYKSASSSDFALSLEGYITLIKFAKKLRPNIQWGYYGVPFTTYWNRDSKWKKGSAALEPLLKECDLLFPTFYNAYKNGSYGKDDNDSFAQDNMKQMLVIGSAVNKPVMPFVWHRYHPGNKQIALQLIPMDDFANYINVILNVTYQGNKAKGVIWWGADNYYYRVKSKPLIDEMQQSGQKDFSGYKDSLITKYANSVLKKINN